MKLSDVVNQLRGVLPKYTDVFSSVLGISSITASAGVATIVTSEVHGLVTGANVVLRNATIETEISAVSQDGLVFTFTTDTDHDLTLNWAGHETVALTGFTDSDWNDSFTLIDVPNRRSFKVRSTNTSPTLTGAENLLENRSDGVNGRYAANLVSTTSFTVAGDFIDGDYIGGSISKSQRITGTINLERALEQYTKQELEDYWLFVVMADAEVSKDRNSFSDAVNTVPAGNDIRSRLIDGFNLYIFKNTTQSVVDAIDVCRHDLLLPILRSVFGSRFPTGLTGTGDFKTILLGHQAFDYNRAILIYEYRFQVVMDITDEDTVEDLDTRAFRDIDLTEVIDGDDTTDMTVLDINLDDEPV